MTPATEAPGNMIDRIVYEIDMRTHGRVRDLRVELSDQLVVLRGRVTSYYTKQLALHGALDAVSNGQIVNEIQVI